MANKATLFILDDNIPKISEYVEQSLYDTKINATSLSHLVNNAEWTGHHNLKQLTFDILNSEHQKNGTSDARKSATFLPLCYLCSAISFSSLEYLFFSIY
jgi:hypothetical protein